MLHFIAQAIYAKGPFCPYIIIIGQGELESTQVGHHSFVWTLFSAPNNITNIIFQDIFLFSLFLNILYFFLSAQVLQNAYGLALLLLLVPYSCAILGHWLEAHLFIPQLNKASGFLHHFAAI